MKRAKTLLMLSCMLVFICLIMPMSVYAVSENDCWTKVDDGWILVDDEGTDLTAKIRGTTLYIQGTGAVPSYTRDCLGNRPWHNQTIYKIEIGSGVTSIGAEAFSNFKNLTTVTMPASVFIEDSSAFAGAEPEAYFIINGTNIVSRNIGNIPYTSYDSIVAFMERYNYNYRYLVANYYMVSLAQEKANGVIYNLTPSDVVTKDYNPDYPLRDLNTSVYIVDGGTFDMKATAVSRQQGLTALEIFSMVIEDRTYIGAYNIDVSRNGKKISEFDAPVTLTMTIPECYQFPNRKFTLIQLGPGVINLLEDEDTEENTITFTTDYPTTTYALVYEDTFDLNLTETE